MATWASPAGSGDALNREPLAAPPARLRPGRVWYLVALAVIVAGGAWLLAGLGPRNRQIHPFPPGGLSGDGERPLTPLGRHLMHFQRSRVAARERPALTRLAA